MPITSRARSFSKCYLPVVCPCGRQLRARIDQAGESIHCWDCRQEVPVPFPRSLDRLGKCLGIGLRDVFCARTLGGIVLTSAFITGALLVPMVGRPLVAVMMVLVSIAYGMLIRRIGLHGMDEEGLLSFNWADILRVAVTLFLCVFAVSPWLISHGGLGHPPRLSVWGGIPAVLVFLLMPLAMLVTWGPLGPKRALGVGPRYPFTTIACVAILPAALLLAECAAVFAAFVLGVFSPLIVDVFPNSEQVMESSRMPYMGFFPNETLPDPMFIRLYGIRLSRGYCLTTAVPSSLADPTTLDSRRIHFDVRVTAYLLARMTIATIVSAIILTALALQARWLGLLARLDSREALVT